MQELNLSVTEQLFLGLVQAKGDLVEVKEDKSEVIIDGTNRGSFEDVKAIFASEWNAADTSVSNSVTKESGVVYNAVTCSATDIDLQSVTSTVMAMTAIPGQTNIDILFANGETLTILNDADLANFLAVWYPFRKNHSTGYSLTEKLT